MLDTNNLRDFLSKGSEIPIINVWDNWEGFKTPGLSNDTPTDEDPNGGELSSAEALFDADGGVPRPKYGPTGPFLKFLQLTAVPEGKPLRHAQIVTDDQGEKFTRYHYGLSMHQPLSVQIFSENSMAKLTRLCTWVWSPEAVLLARKYEFTVRNVGTLRRLDTASYDTSFLHEDRTQVDIDLHTVDWTHVDQYSPKVNRVYIGREGNLERVFKDVLSLRGLICTEAEVEGHWARVFVGEFNPTSAVASVSGSSISLYDIPDLSIGVEEIGATTSVSAGVKHVQALFSVLGSGESKADAGVSSNEELQAEQTKLVLQRISTADAEAEIFGTNLGAVIVPPPYARLRMPPIGAEATMFLTSVGGDLNRAVINPPQVGVTASIQLVTVGGDLNKSVLTGGSTSAEASVYSAKKLKLGQVSREVSGGTAGAVAGIYSQKVTLEQQVMSVLEEGTFNSADATGSVTATNLSDYTVPSVPTDFSAVGTPQPGYNAASTVTLTWTETDGGGPITRREVNVLYSGETTPVSYSGTFVSGYEVDIPVARIPGTHQVRVRVRNSLGWSPWTAYASFDIVEYSDPVSVTSAGSFPTVGVTASIQLSTVGGDLTRTRILPETVGATAAISNSEELVLEKQVGRFRAKTIQNYASISSDQGIALEKQVMSVLAQGSFPDIGATSGISSTEELDAVQRPTLVLGGGQISATASISSDESIGLEKQLMSVTSAGSFPDIGAVSGISSDAVIDRVQEGISILEAGSFADIGAVAGVSSDSALNREKQIKSILEAGSFPDIGATSSIISNAGIVSDTPPSRITAAGSFPNIGAEASIISSAEVVAVRPPARVTQQGTLPAIGSTASITNNTALNLFTPPIVVHYPSRFNNFSRQGNNSWQFFWDDDGSTSIPALPSQFVVAGETRSIYPFVITLGAHFAEQAMQVAMYFSYSAGNINPSGNRELAPEWETYKKALKMVHPTAGNLIFPGPDYPTNIVRDSAPTSNFLYQWTVTKPAGTNDWLRTVGQGSAITNIGMYLMRPG